MARVTSNVSDLVKVKPLQWRGATSDCFMCAETMLGDYHLMVEYDDEWTCDFEPRGGRPVNIIRWRNSPDAAKAAAQSDYESRILAALTPAEQCFSVKMGYGAVADDPMGMAVPLSDALTIRSAEEVRRELWESAINLLLEKGSSHGANVLREAAPSTDTPPSVAEAAQVLLDAHHEGTAKFGKGRSIEQVSVILSFLRALAEQTGGE